MRRSFLSNLEPKVAPSLHELPKFPSPQSFFFGVPSMLQMSRRNSGTTGGRSRPGGSPAVKFAPSLTLHREFATCPMEARPCPAAQWLYHQPLRLLLHSL